MHKNMKLLKLKSWVLAKTKLGICVEGICISTKNSVLWHSSEIEERIDSRLIQTSSGSRYELVGPMSEQINETMKKFPVSTLRKFRDGFPENWKCLLDRKKKKRRKTESDLMNFKEMDPINLNAIKRDSLLTPDRPAYVKLPIQRILRSSDSKRLSNRFSDVSYDIDHLTSFYDNGDDDDNSGMLLRSSTKKQNILLLSAPELHGRSEGLINKIPERQSLDVPPQISYISNLNTQPSCSKKIFAHIKEKPKRISQGDCLHDGKFPQVQNEKRLWSSVENNINVIRLEQPNDEQKEVENLSQSTSQRRQSGFESEETTKNNGGRRILRNVQSKSTGRKVSKGNLSCRKRRASEQKLDLVALPKKLKLNSEAQTDAKVVTIKQKSNNKTKHTILKDVTNAKESKQSSESNLKVNKENSENKDNMSMKSFGGKRTLKRKRNLKKFLKKGMLITSDDANDYLASTHPQNAKTGDEEAMKVMAMFENNKDDSIGKFYCELPSTLFSKSPTGEYSTPLGTRGAPNLTSILNDTPALILGNTPCAAKDVDLEIFRLQKIMNRKGKVCKRLTDICGNEEQQQQQGTTKTKASTQNFVLPTEMFQVNERKTDEGGDDDEEEEDDYFNDSLDL